MSQGFIPAVLHFFICLLYWCAILFTYAAAHNFGWDDTGGTGDRNKFRANNEICGRDCKVLHFALSLHLLLALLCPILTTLSILTDWRNNQAQPASYPSRFQSVSVVKVSLASRTEHLWCDQNHRRQYWLSRIAWTQSLVIDQYACLIVSSVWCKACNLNVNASCPVQYCLLRLVWMCLLWFKHYASVAL